MVSAERAIASYGSVFFAVIGTILVYLTCSGEDTDDGYLGGFNGDHLFSYHPFFMTLGMILFSIMALNSYAILPLTHKLQKLIHVLFHSLAIICFSIGLHFVVSNHNGNNPTSTYSANLFSLHSWCGLAAMVIYAQNFLMGFYSFITTIPKLSFVKRYMPSHLKLGIFSLCLSMAAVVSGITELKICSYAVDTADINPASHYSNDMSNGCKLLQGGGICVMCAVMLSLYALIPNKPSNRDDDEHEKEGNMETPLI
jgi:hypothetical protein